MTPRPRLIALALAIASAVAVALTGSAQANVQLPGLNGKIAFVSSRDYPSPVVTKGEDPSCFDSSGEDENCQLEIYSMNPDGSVQTRLTNNLHGDVEPAWLPSDGSTIAFTSNRVLGCEFCFDIWAMPGGGDAQGPSVQLTSDDGDEMHPSYSPDGTRIAYEADNQSLEGPANARQIVEYAIEEPFQIMTMPAGGEMTGTPTPLLPAGQTGEIDDSTAASDSLPAWSPDGSKVAFTRVTFHLIFNDAAARVAIQPSGETVDVRTYVAPANGSGPATPLETYDPCFETFTTGAAARDAASTLVKALASPQPGGLTRALAGKGVVLEPGCTFDLKPAWSPDGTKIAVTRWTSPPFPASPARGGIVSPGTDYGDIVVLNTATGGDIADLSDVTEPADCNTGQGSPECSVDEYPSWSPDGTKIAFDSNRQADGSAKPDCPAEGGFNCIAVWVMNADGTGPVQLTNSAGDDFFPDWQRIPLPPAPPATPPVAPASKPKIGVAGVRRACVSRSFHVRFHVATSSSVKSVVVKLDRRRIKSTKRSSFTLTINGRKLKSGRHRLTITATDSAGHVTTTHKSFSVCKAAKPRRKAAPRFTG